MIDGNIKGVLYLTKAIIPQMINRESGHIINISSIAGKQTYENGAVYCASKKAVEALSEGMRLDLSKHQIRVSNIAPGAVETDFSMIRFKGDVEKSKKVYQGYSPLIADDIADLIEYIIHAPKRVNIADVSILPSAQSSASIIYKQKNHSIN
jgi:NADP-dependent 3-hydroxy acid dehydrogenase YdfG